MKVCFIGNLQEIKFCEYTQRRVNQNSDFIFGIAALVIKEAFVIANDILTGVHGNWCTAAENNKLSKSAIEYMKPAFAATQI